MADDGDFAPLELELDRIADAVAPAGRKKLGREIATDLRTRNAKRIRANVTPDDAPMVPRKAKASGNVRPRRLRDTITRVKRTVRIAKMFQRATGSRYLRKESSEGEAQVGFVGAMARIMRVHHYGLRDTVTRDPTSPAVTYPERQVIGLTADDRIRILDQVASALAD